MSQVRRQARAMDLTIAGTPHSIMRGGIDNVHIDTEIKRAA